MKAENDPVTACYAAGALVPLTLRLGVTGHRPDRLPADLAPLAGAAAKVVDAVRAVAERLNAAPSADLLYATGNGPVLRVVSALAEGSDRLVAEAALDRGFALTALLPFEATAYEADFAPGRSLADPAGGTVKAFRALLGRAEASVSLDGRTAPDEARTRAYLRAGELTVAHSDLLVAVWDGGEARGEGGTAQIIRLACRSGVAVVLIDPAAPNDPALLLPADHVAPGDALPPPAPFSADALFAFLETRLLPEAALSACAPQLRHFAHERGFAVDARQTADFVNRGPLIHRGRMAWFGRLYALLFELVVPRSFVRARQTKAPPAPAASPIERDGLALHRFYAAFLRADRLALHYARLSRTTFVAIYLLGAIALGCAAAALGYGHAMLSEAWHLKVKDLLTLIELVLLAAIGLLVLADRRLHWHHRWLDYRLLAELLRPMPHLALVAATVPAETVRQSGAMRLDRHGRVRGAGAKAGPVIGGWVFAQFEAVLRHAGLPAAAHDAAYLARCRRFVADNLLADQIRYHEGTAIRNAALERRLMRASTALFLATLVIVALKLGLGLGGFETTWLGFLATFLPAAAAACYGIRSHAELDIVARRSEEMAWRLERIGERLERLGGDALSADAIASAVRQAAEVMVRDAVGWLSIFEAKEPEPA